MFYLVWKQLALMSDSGSERSGRDGDRVSEETGDLAGLPLSSPRCHQTLGGSALSHDVTSETRRTRL